MAFVVEIGKTHLSQQVVLHLDHGCTATDFVLIIITLSFKDRNMYHSLKLCKYVIVCMFCGVSTKYKTFWIGKQIEKKSDENL